jgi:hypothetical protein
MPRIDLIAIRGDTAVNWEGDDPVLADREIAYDQTNNQIRIGDGATAWTSLAAIGSAGGLPSMVDQEGTWLTNDGTNASWAAIVLPPTWVIQEYDDVNDARTVGANVVVWIPTDLTLGNPVNFDAADLLLRDRSIESVTIPLSDLTTELTTGTGKNFWRLPFAATIISVRAALVTASSSGDVTFDVNLSNTTIFSTPLTIDEGDTTSVGADVPAVISDGAGTDDEQVRFDIDGAGTDAAGATVTLYYVRAA